MKHLKRKIAGILLAAAMALSMTACSFGGTKPVLTVAGKEVILGETDASVFTGFQITLPGGGAATDDLPGMSWMTSFLCLEKGKKEYAYLYVYNPKRQSVRANSARIYKVAFTMNGLYSSYWAEDNVLVNGIDFFGMNMDEVKEVMSEYKLSSEYERLLFYKDGKYSYTFKFTGEGIVDEVEVEMKIDKSYN